MAKSIQVHAITLSSSPFEDHHRLLSLFTRELGLLKVFVKNAKTHLHLLRPYCHIDCLLNAGKKDLYYFQEGKEIKNFISIDSQESLKSLEMIELAGRLCEALQSIQLPGKATPRLYMLLEAYLSVMPLMRSKEALFRSFQLKLLMHEGILGEFEAVSLTEEERLTIETLSQSRSLWEIDHCAVNLRLGLKIQAIFDFAKGGT